MNYSIKTIGTNLGKVLGIGALALTVEGCFDSPKYETGIVTKESGTVVQILESQGLAGTTLMSSKQLNYIISVDTKKGTYTINVREEGKSLFALAEAIKPGDSVKFITDGATYLNADNKLFSSDRIGTIASHNVTKLEK